MGSINDMIFTYLKLDTSNPNVYKKNECSEDCPKNVDVVTQFL